MTVTKNADCTQIIVTDDLIATFDGTSGDETLILYVKYNDGTEVAVEILRTDVSSNVYTLLPEKISQEAGDPFCDGIYCLRLVYDDTTNQTTARGSIFIDCAITCTIAKALIADPKRQELYNQYEAILYYQNCNDCDCDTVYNIYESLTIDLDSDINLCGCN